MKNHFRLGIHQFRIGLAVLATFLVGVAYADPTFRIDSLTPDNYVSREVNFVTGDDRGGIAVSGSRVFLSGDGATGIFDHGLSTTGTVSSGILEGIFTNVKDQSAWTLGTSATTAVSYGGGSITHMVQLDPVTGALTGNSVALSAPVSVGYNTGIFGGYDRVLLNTGMATIQVNLTDGVTTTFGSIGALGHSAAESWAYWGVAEVFGGDQYLAYVQNSQTIVRTRVSDGLTSTIASFSNISDMASFTVSPSEGRWYYHYEGSGVFGNRDETLGYASAAFTLLAETPVISAVPEPGEWAMMLVGLGVVGALSRRRKLA
jgi:hypothetical protein